MATEVRPEGELDQAAVERLDGYVERAQAAAGAFRKLDQELPPDATVLVRPMPVSLGINRRVMLDQPGAQGLISYAGIGGATALRDYYERLGITHVAFNEAWPSWTMRSEILVRELFRVTPVERLGAFKVAEVAQGENCLLGAVTEDEYRTLSAAAQAYGHKLITLAPCDINKQKQVNILVSDMGFPLEDIVIYPTTTALGYGMEYIYSILERGRLAALSGDKLMAPPVILDVGYEAWRAKETRSDEELDRLWGPGALRGPAWEAITATNLLQGGADLLVMSHPKAVEAVRNAIKELVGTQPAAS